MRPIQILVAYVADLAFADPPWLPHPVRVFGRAATAIEKLFRKFARTPIALRVAGALMTLFITAGAGFGSWLLLRWISRFAPLASSILAIYLAYTALSVRGLDKAGAEVLAHLEKGRLDCARSALAMIVGRDTASADEPEIVRAVIETVAENTSDGVVAPLFYLGLGGVAGALAYKAINTLDSMVGYKNERYRDFGWFAARLDNVINFIPARLAAALVIVASFLLRFDGKAALRAVREDAHLQPSPNSGYPEAAYAGALGVRLGGVNFYGGVASYKAYLGEPVRELKLEVYSQARRLLYVTSTLAALVSIAIAALVGRFLWL